LRKNPKFKVKTNWEAETINKEVEAFGWEVCNRIKEMIKSKIHDNIGQNISNKEKTALRKIIRAKNNKIVIIDTDKNMGAADADKKDVVFECARQLLNIKTHLKFSEEDLKSIISDIQKYTQNGQWKVTCTKKAVLRGRISVVKNVYI